MRYLAINADGSVVPIILVPQAITHHATGQRARVLGVGFDEQAGLRYVWGEFGRIVFGDERFDVGDLDPETIPGYTLHFPDVQRDAIQKWIQPKRDAVVSVRPLDKREVPSTRWFRPAWHDRDGALDVDMVKARECQRDYMRIARAKAFPALDVAELSALARRAPAAEVEAIEAQKQALRDAPADPALEAAQTPAELEAVWPVLLGPKPRIQALR